MEAERMFAAVGLPEHITRHLEALVAPRRDDDWRWLEPDWWHVTLTFCESVETWRQETFIERLAEAAARTEPFTLSLHGVGCFPDVSRAKVLFSHVSDPADALAPLAIRCKNAATSSGIRVQRERFVPHVTLARSRQPVEASRWVRALVELWTPSWDVTEFVLITSHLGATTGPRYEVRERFPLGTRSHPKSASASTGEA